MAFSKNEGRETSPYTTVEQFNKLAKEIGQANTVGKARSVPGGVSNQENKVDSGTI